MAMVGPVVTITMPTLSSLVRDSLGNLLWVTLAISAETLEIGVPLRVKWYSMLSLETKLIMRCLLLMTSTLSTPPLNTTCIVLCILVLEVIAQMLRRTILVMAPILKVGIRRRVDPPYLVVLLTVRITPLDNGAMTSTRTGNVTAKPQGNTC